MYAYPAFCDHIIWWRNKKFKSEPKTCLVNFSAIKKSLEQEISDSDQKAKFKLYKNIALIPHSIH
jgi:hypothetical protein